MTVEELIAKLKRAIDQGRINADDDVLIRDLSVDDEAMKAGSNGYAELEEVLILPGGPRLLIGGW